MSEDDAPTTQRNLVIEISPSRMEALERRVESLDAKLDALEKHAESGDAKLDAMMRMLKDLADETMRFRQGLAEEQRRGKRVERKLGLVRCVREDPCDGNGNPFDDEEAETGPNGATLSPP